MPGASRLSEAIALDEEHVAQIIEAREKNPDGAPKGPRLSEYTPTVERLDVLIEEIRSNTRATIAAAGARPPKTVEQPRPVTAFDKMQHQRRLAQHESLTRRILGSGD